MIKKTFPILLLLVFLFSIHGFARDYFVIDSTHDTVQTSTNDAGVMAQYTEFADPETVIPGKNPGERLVLFLPCEYLYDRTGNNQVPEPEKGIVYQIEKDAAPRPVVELGYARFVKAVSPDKKQLLITSHGKPGDSTF